MKRLGIIRLESFKRMSFALKKALGIQHGHALDKLSRACGMASYHELRLLVVEGRQREEQLASGTEEELRAVWRNQVTDAFGANVDVVVGAETLDLWFKKVFVPRERLVEKSSVDDASVSDGVVDPMLEASNWRDEEFRAWVQGLVVRPSQPVRVEVKRRRKCELRADEFAEFES